MAVKAKTGDQVIVSFNAASFTAAKICVGSYDSPIVCPAMLARNFPSIAKQSGRAYVTMLRVLH